MASALHRLRGTLERRRLRLPGHRIVLLHVSADVRGNDIGRALFIRACGEARALGAQKLYISAHSSEETIAFYRRMGCTEAQEYDAALVALEPCDCQMEFTL